MKSFPILQKARLIKERKPPRNADLMRRSRTVEGYGVLSQQIGYRKFNRLLAKPSEFSRLFQAPPVCDVVLRASLTAL
jgi:hypothetical protein